MNTTIHHSTIKMWPFNVNSSTFINFGIRTMKKNSKFEVGCYEIIPKYKNIFAKGYSLN